jgi:hypothetical protein
MGVMKRLHTERMVRVPAPLEMPDVVALRRCKLRLASGLDKGTAAHGGLMPSVRIAESTPACSAQRECKPCKEACPK